MNKTSIILAAVLALSISQSGAAKTRQVKTVIPDAVTADGAHYSVDFENACVRVLRIRFAPNAKGNMHDHPHSVTVFLTPGNLRMTLPDGTSRVGAPPVGAAVWEEAGPHQPENLSDQPFEAVRVELKDSRTCKAREVRK